MRPTLPACLLLASTPALGEDPAPRTVLFSSTEVGGSQFASLGFKRALTGGLHEGGLVALAHAGFGGMREPTAAGEPLRYATQGAALVGFQQAFDGLFVTVVAGPELDASHALTRRTQHRPKLGGRTGGRLAAEAWIRPGPDTLITAHLVAGSARGHAWGRVAAGYRTWRDAYLGPELGFYHEGPFREWRLGVHATGLRWRGHEFRLSGGYRRAGPGDDGFYVAVARHRTW